MLVKCNRKKCEVEDCRHKNNHVPFEDCSGLCSHRYHDRTRNCVIISGFKVAPEGHMIMKGGRIQNGHVYRLDR